MEVINSFFSNIKNKLTNPYFGTLIIVLLIHHWELVFSIFNFDKAFTLEKKFEFLKSYIVNNITWSSFLLDAILALLYMFLGYMIIIFTRSIVLYIEFSLMPSITNRIVSKKVVLRTEYDEVVQEREQYFDQYEEQRNYVRNFSKTIDEQTEQIKQKDYNLIEQTNTISETIITLDSTKKELQLLKVDNEKKSLQIEQFQKSITSLERDNSNYLEKIIKYEQLYFNETNKNFYSTVNNFPPEILNKVQELKNDSKWNAFLRLGQFFETGGSLGGELLTEMIKRGLAFERGNREDFTPIGKIIYRYNKVFNDNLDNPILLKKTNKNNTHNNPTK